MSGADDQRAAPWTVRHVDGWWCVYFSDGSLGAQFAIEGDARTFADVAGPGEGTVILRSDLDRLRAELDRLHSWDGLMSLLDEHWPVDIFRADPMEAAADPGPRIVALLRWVDRLRAELAETRDRRAYLQGQLDIIYDAEYSRNDALRRENARLRDAGNALAAGVDEHLMGAGEWGPLVEERRAWRSAAGTPTPNAGEQT